ncbi:hypothetical protein [Micrococcus luteus]|uniref:hypothetical protein n=1 Tax=Micrococcus luteus TaxID=1270 RepID=UPI003B837296
MAHEDSGALRRMAVFDVIVNNADREGAHIHAMPGGHRCGIRHGLTFHVEDKLRTVLWGWLVQALSAEERDGGNRVGAGLGGELGRGLAELIGVDEIGALAERSAGLFDGGPIPALSGITPAMPWQLSRDVDPVSTHASEVHGAGISSPRHPATHSYVRRSNQPARPNATGPADP